MKKIILTAITIMTIGFANAQSKSKKSDSQTSTGKFVIEANTGSFSTGSTAISYISIDNNSSLSVGLDGGYFIMDNFALKAGLGFTSLTTKGSNSTTIATYKFGAQYYILNKIPVGVDFTGLSTKSENANWIGMEAGYAIFLGENVAITPKLRYNATLDEVQAPSSFQGLVGFSLYF